MKYTDLMAHLGFGAPERKPLTDKKPVLNLTKASQVDAVNPTTFPPAGKEFLTSSPTNPQPKKKTTHGRKARTV